MTITAKIIADSISTEGIRLTSFQLRYPKFIHGELMTHRVFSRNASSSRAIPVERLIQDVLDDPAMPIHWGKNQKGMQAFKENDARVIVPFNFDHLDSGSYSLSNEEAWLLARDHAVMVARAMHRAGYHKQIVNRLLEPFCHINVLVSATDYQNFFALRNHLDAQPEIRELAIEMELARFKSSPQLLLPGEWHLPYVENPRSPHRDIKLSVGRSARVSYLTQDGKTPAIEDDLKLYERLVGSKPLHASPAEHQATPDTGAICVDASEGPRTRKPFWQWDNPQQHGNFRGWRQFRKMLPGEFVPG